MRSSWEVLVDMKDLNAGGGIGADHVDGEGIDRLGGIFWGDFSGSQAGDGDGIEAGEFEGLGRVEQVAVHGFSLGHAEGDEDVFSSMKRE